METVFIRTCWQVNRNCYNDVQDGRMYFLLFYFNYTIPLSLFSIIPVNASSDWTIVDNTSSVFNLYSTCFNIHDHPPPPKKNTKQTKNRNDSTVLLPCLDKTIRIWQMFRSIVDIFKCVCSWPISQSVWFLLPSYIDAAVIFILMKFPLVNWSSVMLGHLNDQWVSE